MTSFAFPPLAPGGAISGSLALDFGPAALLVGAALLLIGAFLAASALRSRSSTPPPRSRAAAKLRRLGRSFGHRTERRRHVAPPSHARLA